MSNVFLFEDHDQALKVWRKAGVRGLDLVHVDAHIDFGRPEAEDVPAVLAQAQSVADLKSRLEHAIAFAKYADDFSRLITIGNFVYPAMRDGLVRDFYWVVPGDTGELRASRREIVAQLRAILRQTEVKEDISFSGDGTISARVLDRKVCVCVLDNLPYFPGPALLDIDTDFLMIGSVRRADNTSNIGQRRPWIQPRELAALLMRKVRQPALVTIAYSANGGYTPLAYRHWGDELAFLFRPDAFARQLVRNRRAAGFFADFIASGNRKDYWGAVRLNRVYRMADNNFGPLYLGTRKFRQAEREFLKILKVDPHNPASLSGLGLLALERRQYRKAKVIFLRAIRPHGSEMFTQQRATSLLGLAEAEYGLHRTAQARKLLVRCVRREPLDPRIRFLLGRIAEEEKDLSEAVRRYQEALQLGYSGIDVLYRLAKISLRSREKKSIIRYIAQKFSGVRLHRRKGLTADARRRVTFIRHCIQPRREQAHGR